MLVLPARVRDGVHLQQHREHSRQRRYIGRQQCLDLLAWDRPEIAAQVVDDPICELAWRSLGEEANKAFGGEEGPTRSVPHAYYVAIQQIYSSGVLWIGCALWAILASIRRIRVTFAEWVLLATALLLYSPALRRP